MLKKTLQSFLKYMKIDSQISLLGFMVNEKNNLIKNANILIKFSLISMNSVKVRFIK